MKERRKGLRCGPLFMFSLPKDAEGSGLLQGAGHEEKQDGIHRPLDQIFNGAGRKKGDPCPSVDHGKPPGSKNDIAEDDDDQLGDQHPLKRKGLLVQEHAVNKGRQHGVEGKAGHKAAVRLQHVFNNIHGAAEKRADEGAEQVIHQLVGQSA